MQDVNKRVRQFRTDVEDPAATLQVDETSIPQPKDNEALVRFILRPVNPADVLMMQGLYGSSQPDASEFPLEIGLEGVAEIVKSKKFSPGQRVVAMGWGRRTWQTYLTVSEDVLVAVPSEVTNAQAAVVWINPVTVLGIIKTLDVPKGKWLLQSAAGSAFGRQVLQVCKHYGIKTFNIVRRSSQKQELLDLGADVVIATEEEQVGPAVAKVTGGKGAYAGIDPVGGELTGQLLGSLREYGTLCVYGMLSGTTSTVNIQDLLFRGKRLHGYHLRDYWGSLDSKGQADLMQEIFMMLSTGVIVEYVGKTFPLEQVKEAVEEAQKASRGGKVYLSN